MVTVFCRLERIGGISGKRIQIKRINSLTIGESYDKCGGSWKKVKAFRVDTEQKSDVLKVRDEIIDLDRFLELSKEQSEYKNRNFVLGGSNYTDSDVYFEDDYIALLEYDKGEVSKFGLIKLKDIFAKIPSGDLKTGNYPFVVNGLRATII